MKTARLFEVVFAWRERYGKYTYTETHHVTARTFDHGCRAAKSVSKQQAKTNGHIFLRLVSVTDKGEVRS